MLRSIVPAFRNISKIPSTLSLPQVRHSHLPANKDKKLRITLNRIEPFQKVRKALRVDALCSPEFSSDEKGLLIEKFLMRGLDRRSKTKLVHRCILTGKAKVMYKSFKIHRTQLKDLLDLGEVPGFRPAIW